MKKIFGIILSLVLLAGASMPAFAQKSKGAYAQSYRSQSVYDRRYDRRYDDRSFWEKNRRDILTIAAGAGAGAVIGGLAKGKKGAAAGAIVGGGGAAVYTYILRDRDDNRYRRR